jgi:hypothetical protein
MKLTIIFAGVLAANSLAVAQNPVMIIRPDTNQVQQAPALPDTSRPQQPIVTNQTNGASSTNLSSSATTSNNVSNTSTTTANHPVTIIRGSDATATTNSSGHIPAQVDNGLDPVKSTAGTPDDWRSGNSVPHVVPPRDSTTSP